MVVGSFKMGKVPSTAVSGAAWLACNCVFQWKYFAGGETCSKVSSLGQNMNLVVVWGCACNAHTLASWLVGSGRCSEGLEWALQSHSWALQAHGVRSAVGGKTCFLHRESADVRTA